MIVLDTNVLSEPLRTRPDEAVMSWLASASAVRVTAVSVGELLVGARILPVGQRRTELLTAIEGTLNEFQSAVLPYDDAAARVYAEMQEVRRAAGVPLSVEDGIIAAICVSAGATLATRNVKDFQGIGLAVVNPWEPVPLV